MNITIKTNIVVKWGAPIPGKEFQYYIAWVHRDRIMRLINKIPTFCFIFNTKKYSRLMNIWGGAVERTKMYGRDAIYDN